MCAERFAENAIRRVGILKKKKGGTMPKRKRFYLNAAVWEKEISSAAFHVYGFLSWCANKDGSCYPSIAEIARRCHISQNTARRALRELEQTGLIQAQTQFTVTKSGKRRQTSNSYLLKHQIWKPLDSNTAPSPCQFLQGMGANVEGEINHKEIDIKIGISSVGLYEEKEITDILDGLSLYSYENEHFAKAIELAIREMYYAENITVGGERIPQRRVRERLRYLDTSCIDHIHSRMRDYGANFQSAGKYLISCLYNAPMDFNTDIAAFSAAL